jgi:hypothetical protein
MDSNVKEKLSVCISSVFLKEPDFIPLRLLAKQLIEEHSFLQGIRNPEDVKTQEQFDDAVRDALALVVILGTSWSDAVVKEIRLALYSGVPVIPLIKTVSIKGRLTASPAALDMLASVYWNLERVKLYFNNADHFKDILRQQLNHFLIWRLLVSCTIYDNRIDMYTKVAKFLSESTHLVAIGQRTATLLLGPKQDDPREPEFYESLKKMFLRLKSKKLNRVVYLFDYSATSTALSEQKKYPHVEEAKSFLLENILTDPPSNLLIRATSTPITPFLLADNALCCKLSIGEASRYTVLPSCIVGIQDVNAILGLIERMGSLMTKVKILRLYERGTSLTRTHLINTVRAKLQYMRVERKRDNSQNDIHSEQ